MCIINLYCPTLHNRQDPPPPPRSQLNFLFKSNAHINVAQWIAMTTNDATINIIVLYSIGIPFNILIIYGKYLSFND